MFVCFSEDERQSQTKHVNLQWSIFGSTYNRWVHKRQNGYFCPENTFHWCSRKAKQLKTNTQAHMKNKGYYTLLGFLLFIIGISAIVLQVVGVQWAFLSFLERIGRLFAFVIKVLMVMAGIIIIVLARTDWEREKRESSED